VPVFRTLVFGLLLLGGCAAAPQIMWWRDDFSAEEFADDSALCLNYAGARLESPAGARVDASQRQELTRQLYDYCLSSLGYYQVELGEGRLRPLPPAPPLYDIRFHDISFAPARPAHRPADL
jgi:hypothetical protein